MQQFLSLYNTLESMMLPDETPMNHAEVLSKLRAADTKLPVIVKGQYSPDPMKAERILVFDENGNRLLNVLDAWITPETYQQVIASFSGIARPRFGSCSAMAGTKPKYIWAVRDKELRLWHSRALVARFTPQQCLIRRRFVGSWSKLPISEFNFVHAFVSTTWVRREVVLESDDGRNIVIARAMDLMPIIDPTYDGLDVMCDTSWARSLAESISVATAIPLKLNKLL